ncbi:MAG: restriction endonuclease [Bacteroidales bacterium]|nr:restriction endonuclease [Bacteroidales bacterium]
MIRFDFHQRFEKIIEQIFFAYGFQPQHVHPGVGYRADLRLIQKDILIYCEIKFYRSKIIPSSTIYSACERLAYLVKSKTKSKGLLIVSSAVTLKLKEEVLDRYKIILWDRGDLYYLLKSELLDSSLLEDFEKLLIEAKQGIDIVNVFEGIEIQHKEPNEYISSLCEPFPIHLIEVERPHKKGKSLCQEMNTIINGREGWHEFERKCEEILKYLFEEDLTLWNRQTRTDDELARFDLICRINSNDDFWKMIIQLFRSRYILFEFKNYTDKIEQNQIYTTERYLFTKALRSVCILIARNGANDQAISASKGALREHGKLILILDIKDLCKMLEIKDNDQMPNDYLSEKLDVFLISLSH